MPDAIIVTPVKDAIASTLSTIKAIHGTGERVHHIVYNDFSSPETKKILEENRHKFNFELIHLEDITAHPSPNYRLVLQDAQIRALKENIPLLIVESDVTVKEDTFKKMFEFAGIHDQSGLVGAITVDEKGEVNFPYLKFKNKKKDVIETNRSLSFCCTLMSLEFLRSYDFAQLDPGKDWYDTFISSKSLELGFRNYILLQAPVTHKQHSSRPWKKLKYSNPLKYYFLKLINRRDKI